MCKHEGCSLSCKRNTVLLVARVLFGAILIVHGWAKLMGPMPGMEGFTGMLASLSFPVPVFWAWLVALLETFGGLAIVLGLWTEKVSMLIGIQFLVIVLYVKGMAWGKSEFDLAMFSLALMFSAFGGGSYALMKPCHSSEDEKK